MNINTILQSKFSEYLKLKYNIDFKDFEIQLTKKDFEGDLTIVIFPLVKVLKQSPANLGNELGSFIVNNSKYVTGFNIIQGFLNLSISSFYYLEFLNNSLSDDNFGFIIPKKKIVHYI